MWDVWWLVPWVTLAFILELCAFGLVFAFSRADDLRNRAIAAARAERMESARQRMSAQGIDPDADEIDVVDGVVEDTVVVGELLPFGVVEDGTTRSSSREVSSLNG